MTIPSDPPESSTSRLCSTRLPLVSLLVSVGLLMFVTMTIDYAKSGWAVNRGILDTVVVVVGLLVVITQVNYLMVHYRLWRVVVDQTARRASRFPIWLAA